MDIQRLIYNQIISSQVVLTLCFSLCVLLCFLRGGKMLTCLCTDLVAAGPNPYQRIYILIITIDQELGVYFSVWFLFWCSHVTSVNLDVIYKKALN